MKLRHAAAIVLVGWYLVSPPWKPDAHGWKHPVPKAPIAEWYFEQKDQTSWDTAREHARIFFSLQDCKDSIEEHKRYSRAWKKRFDEHLRVPDWMFDGIASGDYVLSASSAQCIAMDDPRLKENRDARDFGQK